MSARLIDPSLYRHSLALRDLTDPVLGPHAMQLLLRDAVAALRDRWRCPVVVYRGAPLVNVAENYDELGYSSDGAARDSRHSRYLTDECLLRTQTSAMIPGALRMIAPADYDDVLIACPGLTYRRDSIDRLHVAEPHQVDLWRIAKRDLDRRELEEMIELVAGAMLPAAPLRIDPAEHPYTTGGLEVHARVADDWVEVLECGVAHPAVLERCGVPSATYCGLAMGIGLDRMLMLRKGIDDIRVLRSADERIARQMLDLAPYRSVSDQPPIRRDLSIAVRDDLTAAELCDRVRELLGERSASIEAIEVLSETSYRELSPVARARLGISPEQKNVLLRIVIRDLERTLTSAEANRLRDEIYAALHEGAVKSYTSAIGPPE
jgi:phenylalanyl-tRNA synthetase alpha chain